MAHTTTFPVDNIGSPEAVTTDTVCKSVTIGEDGQAATADFYIRQPLATSDPVLYRAGKKVTFTKPGKDNFFDKSETVAYVETASGAATFSKEEE